MSSSQLERRRELRQQRRLERLRQLWRFLVFSAVAGGLGYALLRHGWVLQGPHQIEISGSRQVQRDQVIEAAGLRFPLALLSLQPNQLTRQLSVALPVQQVQVQRLMAPPRLRIQLVDRHAVARAERRGSSGPELGYVDQLGNWMSRQQQGGIAMDPSSSSLTLLVKGWQPRHRQALAELLNHRQQLGSALLAIRFEPEGSLWLDTSSLGAVRFGPVDQRLPQRITVLEHLLRQLPGRLQGRRLQSIDLTDPDQPELALPAAAAPAGQASLRP